MKKIKWTYFITVGLGLVVAVLMLVGQGTFTKTLNIAIYEDISNAFFVPGAVFLCFGVIVWASNGGAFDMLKYGGIKLIDKFRRNVRNKKYPTYYDYREAQKGKGRSFWYFLLIGLAFAIVGAVFLILANTELNKITG